MQKISLASSHVSVLPAWPLELVPRECPADSILRSHPMPYLSRGRGFPVLVVSRRRRSRPHVLVTTRQPSQKTSTNMEEESVFRQRISITKMGHARRSKKYDGRTQETFNQQLTVPPTSDRRQSKTSSIHKFSKSHAVIRQLSSSRNTQGRYNTLSQTTNNHVDFSTARLGPLQSCQVRQSYT